MNVVYSVAMAHSQVANPRPTLKLSSTPYFDSISQMTTVGIFLASFDHIKKKTTN